MFHRRRGLAKGSGRLAPRLMPDELLASRRMLTLSEPQKLFIAHFADETQFRCELAVPDASDALAFRVVVLTAVPEFLGMVAPCLSGAEWLRQRQHRSPLPEERFRMARGRWHAGDQIEAMRWLTAGVYRRNRGRNARHGRRNRPLDEGRMPLRKIDERDVKAGDEIADLHVAVQCSEAGDLACHHERFDLSFQPVALLPPLPFRAALAQALDLDLADRLGDPLRRARLAGAKEDFCCRLRQHRFGVMTVPALELATTLEAKDNGVVGLAVLGDRGVELRQPLQAREFVENEPDPP